MAWVILVGREAAEEPDSLEGVVLGVPVSLKVGVGKDVSVGIDLTSTSGDVSIRVDLILSTSSCVYSTSMCQISLEDVVWPQCLSSQRGTPARRHSYVISTGNGRDVWICMDLMVISYSIISHKLSLFLAMMHLRQAAFGWQRMDSFCEVMTELLMKPNQYRATMFNSFISMGSPASMHLDEVSEMSRDWIIQVLCCIHSLVLTLESCSSVKCNIDMITDASNCLPSNHYILYRSKGIGLLLPLGTRSTYAM